MAEMLQSLSMTCKSLRVPLMSNTPRHRCTFSYHLSLPQICLLPPHPARFTKFQAASAQSQFQQSLESRPNAQLSSTLFWNGVSSCLKIYDPNRKAELVKGGWHRSQTRGIVSAMGESVGESAGLGRTVNARLTQKKQMLEERTLEFTVEDEGPIPTITEEHVTLSFARSGGPGGQNVNKLNTKVDMRFNVANATWLPERIRQKIIQKEQNRINSDGELVISSTRTRTQKGNIEDALQKIQTIINAAAYVPPPPSEEKQKRIEKLAKADNQRRLESKKKMANKKTDRRNKGSWD
eukprot:TRINITY_DN20315_c0_g1_i1.p1 TRINITY_DN20315_c0_g1~~TRINITY_DN20315_c0_g1_i1.p1  ORF type:complete len:294 (-),score=18.24 TRINITY_DN20315_c0_g1_i1:172-1053(-)